METISYSFLLASRAKLKDQGEKVRTVRLHCTEIKIVLAILDIVKASCHLKEAYL